MKLLESVCLIVIACTMIRSAHAQESLPALIKSIKPAVVTIAGFDSAGQSLGTGTGFFVRKNQLVTNYHVLAGAHRAEVKTARGNTYSVLGISAENRPGDLLMLTVEIPEEIDPLDVLSDLPEVGERVIVVGSPYGLEQTVSDGIVSSLRLAPAIDTVIQVTAPFSPGSSGSPVINMQGKVIGVASSQMMGGQNLNFAVPGKWVLSLSPENPTPLAEWTRNAAGKVSVAAINLTLEALGKRGEALMSTGEYEKALTCFQSMAEQNQDLPDVWIKMSTCQAHLGHWDESITLSERALELNPELPEAHYNQGVASGMLGRWKEAFEAYRRTLETEPDNVDALAGLAETLVHLGRSEEAIESCRKAIQLDPKAPRPHRNLADAEMSLGRYDEALVEAKQALDLDPGYVDAFHTLGLAYSYLERHQEAIDAYQEAIRRLPQYAEAHSNLGLAYAHQGQWSVAIQEYKETIRLKPDMAEAHYNLGVAYFRTGDKASALDEYKILQGLNEDLANRFFEIIYE